MRRLVIVYRTRYRHLDGDLGILHDPDMNQHQTPIDHIRAIAALPAERKAFLTRRSDLRGIGRLVTHLCAIAVLSVPIVLELPGWWLAMLPLGILIVFLFTLSHECTHQTPFKTPWLNDALGQIVGLAILLPFTWFRYFHLAHHKYTNDPKTDPELEHGPRPQTGREMVLYVSGWGYWTGMARQLWSNAFGTMSAPYLPQRKHRLIRTEASIILALYITLAGAIMVFPILAWVWVIPALVGQPFLRLYLLAEHGRCPPVANMLENSRTTYTNRLIRWMAWNMPYHAEHHSFPNVPFYNLPELNKDLAHVLQNTSRGYGEFMHDYVQNLDA